jgi:hypothetical protein
MSLLQCTQNSEHKQKAHKKYLDTKSKSLKVKSTQSSLLEY